MVLKLWTRTASHPLKYCTFPDSNNNKREREREATLELIFWPSCFLSEKGERKRNSRELREPRRPWKKEIRTIWEWKFAAKIGKTKEYVHLNIFHDKLIDLLPRQRNKWRGSYYCFSVLGPYHCPKNFSICGFEISRIRYLLFLKLIFPSFQDLMKNFWNYIHD